MFQDDILAPSNFSVVYKWRQLIRKIQKCGYRFINIGYISILSGYQYEKYNNYNVSMQQHFFIHTQNVSVKRNETMIAVDYGFYAYISFLFR